MKKGITSTIAFELEIEVTDVAEVIFTFKEKIDSEEYLLQKSYPEEVTFENNKFLCKLTQEETDSLTNTFFVEAQVNLTNKSVIKSDIGKEIMPPTLWTTFIEDNESSGEEEIITLTFTDYVEGGGGGTGNYNDLSNKPQINSIELIGNKTDTDLGLATKGELVAKADKVDTYTKSETDTLLGAKQDTVSKGNGIDITSNVVSVDLDEYGHLYFNNGKLRVSTNSLGVSDLRQILANTSVVSSYNPLATKQYVDNLMSGAIKRLVVESLPTQDIDTNTIYMVPKSVPSTNNVYDEYMYINNAWELIGTTEVDLSGYQEKLIDGNGINIANDNTISAKVKSSGGINADSNGLYVQASEINEGTDNLITISSNGKLKLPSYTIASDSDVRYGLLQTYQDGNNIQSKIDSTHKLDADLVQNGTTNKVVTQTEKDTWNGKSKIWGAIFDDGILVTSTSYYEGIKQNDLIIHNPKPNGFTNNGETLLWSVANVSTTNFTAKPINVGLIKLTTTTPPTTSDVPLPYQVGSLVITTNGKIYKCTDIQENAQELYDYTWEQLTYAKGEVDNLLGGKQDTIDSTHKLSADNVDDTSTTNKFVTSTEKSTWSGKADNTVISTDTTSTTVSLTLADNHEYRYTQELTSLTLTMPSGDFISSIVFASGSTPTSMTYDSSIKWSGDDVTNGQFVPTEKTYNIVMWYDGLNVNGVVRGV